MRCASLLVLGVSLLGSVVGCHPCRHTAGVCDCDPPPVGAVLYTQPSLARPASPVYGYTDYGVGGHPAGAPVVGVPNGRPVGPLAVPGVPGAQALREMPRLAEPPAAPKP